MGTCQYLGLGISDVLHGGWADMHDGRQIQRRRPAGDLGRVELEERGASGLSSGHLPSRADLGRQPRTLHAGLQAHRAKRQ